MIKRIFIFLVIALALFYAGAGIYFYKKTLRKKKTIVNSEIKKSINAKDLIILKDIFLILKMRDQTSIGEFLL